MVSVMIVTDHENKTQYVVYDKLVYLIQKDKTYLFHYVNPDNDDDKETYQNFISLQEKLMPKNKARSRGRKARTRKSDKGKGKKKQTKKRKLIPPKDS